MKRYLFSILLILLASCDLASPAPSPFEYFAATPSLTPTQTPALPRVLAVESFLADIAQNVAGDRLAANRKVMEELRDKVLLTQEQRLVAVQTELQRLVDANGLDLQNVGYAYESIPRPPQGPWANRYVRLTVQLPLSGTYPAVKAFIRDLLASPHFFSVDELALSGGTQTGVLLRMNLQVSTAFLASEETALEETP
jgi:Tfp pilus assembly protein PilO